MTPDSTDTPTEEIRALCVEFGWTREHDRMLKDGLWKMVRPLHDGGWMGWVFVDGYQGSERFKTPREAMEWCDGMKPTHVATEPVKPKSDAQALAREAVAAWAGREPGDWLRPWEPLTDSITKVIQTHIDRADRAEAELAAVERPYGADKAEVVAARWEAAARGYCDEASLMEDARDEAIDARKAAEVTVRELESVLRAVSGDKP